MSPEIKGGSVTESRLKEKMGTAHYPDKRRKQGGDEANPKKMFITAILYRWGGGEN